MYQPLSGDEIRLVVISPAPPTSPISCRFRNVFLHHNPTYEALSYAWGPIRSDRRYMLYVDAAESVMPNPGTITVEGVDVKIGPNLWEALFSLRCQMEQERIIWIDALCINQNDIQERNHQVAMMSRIYTGASKVQVWLGPETENTADVFSISKSHRAPWFNLERDFLEEEDPMVTHSGVSWMQAVRSFIDEERFYRELISLHQRDYWKRVWIVQEIFLASTVVINCGMQVATWRTFSNLDQIYQKLFETEILYAINRYPGSRDFNLYKNGSPILRSLKNKSSKEGINLLQFLEYFKGSLCSEPRDRVYGFLGLASDCQNGEIVPDYSKSLDAIFLDVLWHHNQKERGRDTLVCFSQYAQRLLQWPLDLDHCKDLNPPGTSVDARTLQVSAIPTGTVIRLGPSFSRVKEFGSTLKEWCAAAKGEYLKSKSGIGIDLLENFMKIAEPQRVLWVSNLDRQQGPPEPTGSCTHPLEPLLFEGENDMVGFVHPSTREGDHIFQFQDCDLAVVARRDFEGQQNQFTLLSRPLIARRIWEKPVRIPGSECTFKYDVASSETGARVELDMDFAILKRITAN